MGFSPSRIARDTDTLLICSDSDRRAGDIAASGRAREAHPGGRRAQLRRVSLALARLGALPPQLTHRTPRFSLGDWARHARIVFGNGGSLLEELLLKLAEIAEALHQSSPSTNKIPKHCTTMDHEVSLIGGMQGNDRFLYLQPRRKNFAIREE